MKIDTLKRNNKQRWLIAVLLGLGLAASHVQATDIDQVTAKVRQTLATRGGEHKYQTLCAAYNTQIHKIETFLQDFLDKNNRTPAKAFIDRLTNDLREFETLILQPMQNDEFLRSQLSGDVNALHSKFKEMFALLNANINTKSGWILAPKLLPYKSLIPLSIRDRYKDPMVVINGLNHRLKCA